MLDISSYQFLPKTANRRNALYLLKINIVNIGEAK